MTSKAEHLTELNISDLSGELVREELVKLVKKLLNSENVKLYTEHGSKKGDNFIGAVYRIIYKDVANSENKNQSSLILKIAPNDRACRDLQKLHDLFLREIFIYSEVLSLFGEIQLSKHVNPIENGFYEYTKCYSSISEDLSEALFLEDLKLRQFEVINHREKPLTYDHLSLVMKALGKFHALSFALRDQQPEIFKQLTGQLNEIYWNLLKTQLNQHYTSLVDRFKNILKTEKQFDLFDRFNKKIGDDLFATIFQFISGATAEPYAVICHGDLTVYNSMYRIDEQGKPVEIQFIDWQFSRYASPIIDIIPYLFCSTTKELRDKHLEDFLKIYHESFSNLLTSLGSDPQKLFSYETFLNEFRKFGAFAGFLGSVLIPIICAEVDSIHGFEAILGNDHPITDDMYRIPNELKQAYNDRVVGMFADLARLECI